MSLDGVLQDVRSLQQGMELTRREFMRQDDSPVLKDFLKVNSEVMEKLQADSKTAKVGAGVGWGHGGSPLHGDTLGYPLLTPLPHGRGSCLGRGSSGTGRREPGRMGRWERLEGGGGRWAPLPSPQIRCLCPQEAYESAVEYFGENPKTSPPTTFFPMFLRFIKAYKVGGGMGSSVSEGWEEIWGT